MFDSLLLMLSGMFLMMFGGWLLLLCTYKGVLLGFMNGCDGLKDWSTQTIHETSTQAVLNYLITQILK